MIKARREKALVIFFGAKNARGIDSWVWVWVLWSGLVVVVVVMAHRETNSGEREPGSDS